MGFHKKGSRRPSITWPESGDQALCFGWIDGVRRRIDDASYSIRFTPRKVRSTWSAVNVRRVGELTTEGLMHPAGVAAFERRSDDKTAIYAYEQRKTANLSREHERDSKPRRRRGGGSRPSPPATGEPRRTGSSAPSGRRPGRGGWSVSSRTPRPAGRSHRSPRDEGPPPGQGEGGAGRGGDAGDQRRRLVRSWRRPRTVGYAWPTRRRGRASCCRSWPPSTRDAPLSRPALAGGNVNS